MQKLISASSAGLFSYFQAKMSLLSVIYVLFCLKCNFFWCEMFLIQLTMKYFCWEYLKNIFRLKSEKIIIFRHCKNHGILMKKVCFWIISEKNVMAKEHNPILSSRSSMVTTQINPKCFIKHSYSQQTNALSKSTIERPEKRVKYVQR